MMKMKLKGALITCLLVGGATAACRDDDGASSKMGAGGSPNDEASNVDGDGDGDGDVDGEGAIDGDGDGDGDGDTSNSDDCQSIFEVLNSDSSVSSFFSAVEAVGMTEEIKEFEFTVFAPNNAAFERALGADWSKFSEQQLLPLINYHLSAENVDAQKLAGKADAEQEFRTLGGQVEVVINDSGLTLDPDEQNAHLLDSNIFACNGIVHVIDRFLLPSIKDIVTRGADYEGLKSSLDASEDSAELLEKLEFKAGEELTLFAPSNEALNPILTSQTSDEIQEVVLYHVHEQALTAEDMASFDGEQLTMSNANSDKLSVTTGDSIVLTDQAQVDHTILHQDIRASNGVIHQVAGVLDID